MPKYNDVAGARAGGQGRHVPRLVVLGPADEPSVLAGFPGRFVIRHCSTTEELRSVLLSDRTDLLLLDCRSTLPHPQLAVLIRQEAIADYLAVGSPPGKKSVPTWMRSHWCPWPVDQKSFYRLIIALSRKAYWARSYREQARTVVHLEEEAALGRHIAQVLHELNNPLDAVTRYVNLAKNENINPEAEEHLANAAIGLKRMTEALSSLLRDSRLTASQLRLEDLRELIREAAAASGVIDGHHEFKVRAIARDFQVPQALLPILINLLQNAGRACGKKGKIELDVKTSAGLLEIAVGDDGEGFGELFAEELFQPWFSTHEKDAGLGLGLYGARNAVEQLGGCLRANSAGLGKGATFTLTLPLVEQTNTAEERD